MHQPATQVLEGHLLVRDRFDYVRAGHEHVARAVHHQAEVGDRRRVDGSARARPHDRRDLRHDPGGQRIADKDVGVAAETGNPFLDTRPAAVVQANNRHAVPGGQVHDAADFLRVRLRQ